MLKYLVSRGVNVNKEFGDKMDALIISSMYGSNQIVKYLCNLKNNKGQKVVDINQQKIKKNSALHIASGAGKFDVVKTLVENNAKLDLQNDDGNTAYYLAVLKRNNEIADYLKEKGANINLKNKDGKNA